MNAPTQVQRRARRFGLLGLAIAAAGGFLAGILLVAILGGAQPVYKERTISVAAQPQGTAVPALVGQRLDDALDRLVQESNWRVVEQDPSPGARLREGDTVTLRVDRA